MKNLHRSRSFQTSCVLIVFCGCVIYQTITAGENVEYFIGGIVAVLANHAINKRKQIQSTGDY